MDLKVRPIHHHLSLTLDGTVGAIVGAAAGLVPSRRTLQHRTAGAVLDTVEALRLSLKTGAEKSPPVGRLFLGGDVCFYRGDVCFFLCRQDFSLACARD